MTSLRARPAGMTSNVRQSVLAGLEKEAKHSVEEALKPVVALQNGGLRVSTTLVILVHVLVGST
jgi:hypothetical protein